MFGCLCRLAVLAAIVGALAYGVGLATRPAAVEPPAPSPEAGASFDRKLFGLIAAQAGSNVEATFSEEELNAKVAQSVAAIPLPVPVRTIYLRLRPDQRITIVGVVQVLGRDLAVVTDLRLVSDQGVSLEMERARLGELPLPVGLFTAVVVPILDGFGLPFFSLAAFGNGLQSAWIDGPNLTLRR